jgi:hypothetical protein
VFLIRKGVKNMIFPEVTIEEWINKFPELEVISRRCDYCGSIMKSEKPFLMKGYAGLVSPNCKCGKNRGLCSSRITISDYEHKRWNKFFIYK